MEYRYDFAVCAIFRNETAILIQWIEHYLRFGCQHFYLINNKSTDDYLSLLQPYIDLGLVDLVHEPADYRQVFAYNEYYLKKICTETRWVGILDLDEFLYPRQGGTDIKQELNYYSGEEADALAVPWLTFGSSGFVKQPENIIESFVNRADYDKFGWTSFKTIVKTSALATPLTYKPMAYNQCVFGIHCHKLRPEKVVIPTFLPKDTELLGKPGPYFYYIKELNIESARLVINHYRVMSLEYYKGVMAQRPSAYSPGADIADGDMKYFHEYDYNELRDDTLKNM